MSLSLYLDKKTRVGEGAVVEMASAFPPGLDEITVAPDNSLFGMGDAGKADDFLSSLKEIQQTLDSQSIEVNLAMDNVCSGGLSVTGDYRKRLYVFLSKFLELRIPLVLSEPMLIDYAVNSFPELKIIVYSPSSHGLLDFHLRGNFYTEVISRYDNVKRLILPSDLNRDFQSIRLVRETVDCEIALIVNEGDVFCNPFRISELTSLSHLSPDGDMSYYRKVESIYQSKRDRIFSETPWRLFSSPWIRPEDLNLYESLGINDFIILANVDREKAGRVIQAYADREYHGNLLGILKYGKDMAGKVNLDNDRLKDFLNNIVQKETCIRDCQLCRVCINEADKLI